MIRVKLITSTLLFLLPSLCFAAKVEVEPLSQRVFYPQLTAPADTVSYKNSALSSKVAGQVIEITPLIGKHVELGELLIRLDDTHFQLTLKQAQAAKRALVAKIKFSKYQLKQAKRLSSQNNVSEERVLQRESELESLMAELTQQQIAIERAESNLADTRVKAPFSGTITKQRINVGEWVNPGTPLIQLLSTNSVEVSAQLHPDDVLMLQAANSAIFSSSQGDFPVTLRATLPLQDSQQRTVEARLTFDDEKAITGSAGRLLWQDSRPHLPANLLTQRAEQLGLFVAKQGKALFIPLPEAQEGRAVLVTHLPANTTLITTGRYALNNGDDLELN
jgi:RND family efflux transporter MFP subunit